MGAVGSGRRGVSFASLGMVVLNQSLNRIEVITLLLRQLTNGGTQSCNFVSQAGSNVLEE